MRKLLMVGTLLICWTCFANDGQLDAKSDWQRIRAKAWEAFHRKIDDLHKDKSVNWLDSGDRRKLLEVAVDSAVSYGLQERDAIDKERGDAPKPSPRQPIPLGSLAWMRNLANEPVQVRVDRGPSEDRQYLVRMTTPNKAYTGSTTVYMENGLSRQVPTESFKEVYRLVHETLLYFPEKPVK